MMSVMQRLTRFAELVRTGSFEPSDEPLRLGVDLGTSNIVLAVADASGHPVAGAWRQASVVRDGVVVDWAGAVQTVRELTAILADRLQVRFSEAAVTVPPGIGPETVKVFTNVLQACELDTAEVVDEPVAAARALTLTDGAIIDIGHGTTGVSLLRNGKAMISIDEPTGGHHMTLIISGALGLDYQEAEEYKCSVANRDQVAGLVHPTLEKMATIAQRALRHQEVPQVQLVGGASAVASARDVFSSVLGLPIQQPLEPLFPTPLGAALRSNHG
ncbi:MAG: ethanolamine utilization protein EutJ [Arachnia propionica]|nr:MAG: ethanolamine utilization protein EutJ [Arachnia propionica]